MSNSQGDVFKALADRHRRFLLDQLHDQDGLTLAELCTSLNMSRQAVSKHLAILEKANLISCLMSGRHKYHYLNPVPLQEITQRWISKFKGGQATALSQLKIKIEGKTDDR